RFIAVRRFGQLFFGEAQVLLDQNIRLFSQEHLSDAHIHYSFHVALLSCMLAVIELAAQMAFFQAADVALKTANAVSKPPLSLGRMLVSLGRMLDGQLCLQSRQLMSQLFGCLNVLVAVGIAPIYPFSLAFTSWLKLKPYS
ncbi:hypothetical protein, partial [Lactobacillus delbrueckii]|uniref:hypothetical protein n=1 Tax=Lactobacillus delbrueckii TaxID=1584 RepID=UPI001F24D530